MNKVILAAGVAAIAIIAFQLLRPPEKTLAPQIGGLIGEIEKAWLNTREEAVAEHKRMVREAEADVQRRDLATRRALDLETEIARKQIENIDNTHFFKRMGAYGADIACGFGAMAQASGRANEAGDLLKMCVVAGQIRESMAQDYRKVLGGNRTDVMREMAEKFNAGQEELKQ